MPEVQVMSYVIKRESEGEKERVGGKEGGRKRGK